MWHGIEPGDLLELEKANVRLVNAFVESWYDPTTVRFDLLADEGDFRTSVTLPHRYSPVQLKDEWLDHLKPTDRVEVEIHQTFCRGPVVTNVRTDIVRYDGKPDKSFEIVSNFYVEGGKIKEWTDHIYCWRELP